MIKTWLFIACILLYINILSQNTTRKEYINQYKNIAIEQMLKHKIPASITLAQGLLESNNGNSPLAVEAKNHFGIKCHLEWQGEGFYQDDDAKNECFRKYNSVVESFTDHSLFLTTRSRYQNLFNLKLTDYKGWAKGLKKAGYATNPKYADILIRIIEENQLMQYDTVTSIPKNNITKPTPIAASNNNTPKQTVTKPIEHKIYTTNNTPYIIANKQDTYLKIAQKYNLRLWQIFKYNDLPKGAIIKKGQKIYLKPKRNKNRETQYHIVQKGETMYTISQKHAVKLDKLYKKNNMQSGDKLVVGQKLSLKKKIRKR